MSEPFAVGNSFKTVERGMATKFVRVNSSTVPFTLVTNGVYSCTAQSIDDIASTVSATITVEGTTYQVTNLSITAKDNAVKLQGTSPTGGEAFGQLFFPSNASCSNLAGMTATVGTNAFRLEVGDIVYAMQKSATSGSLSFK